MSGIDTYTKLLLHCDGVDGATTFIDKLGHGIGVGGNAQIDTAQSVFGGASALFDGSGDYIYVSGTGSDFITGTGDFTIEMWVRPNSASFTASLYDQRPASTNVALTRRSTRLVARSNSSTTPPTASPARRCSPPETGTTLPWRAGRASPDCS